MTYILLREFRRHGVKMSFIAVLREFLEDLIQFEWKRV